MHNAHAPKRKEQHGRATVRFVAAAAMVVFSMFGGLDALAAGPFVPAIKIPTVKFSDMQVTQQTAEGNKIVKSIDVPWIANYVGGVYEYAIAMAVVLAGVMVVIGGFQYQTAGGDSSRVSAAKTRIVDAIIGLLLVLGSNVVLRTINTDLTNPAVLRVTQVKGSPLEPNLSVRPGVEERGGPASDYKPGPPSPGAEPAVIEGWKKAGSELNVDSCVVIGIGDHESGNKVNIWNGKPGGLPRDKAVAWGPGQVIHPNFVTSDPKKSPKPLSIALKKKFGDKWPDDTLPVEEQKQKKTEAMITDAELSTYAATFLFKSVGGQRGNELYALASYAAGGGSIAAWRKANGCTGTKVSMAEAATMGFEAAMQKACLPIAIVAVPGAGSSCPGDKGECRNAKVDKTATFVGTCEEGPDKGKKCVGMDTNGFIRYILGRYNAYKTKYQCQ
jgi:hypothetical protein